MLCRLELIKLYINDKTCMCTLHVETADSFFDAWSGIQIYIKSPANLRWQSRGCQLKLILIHLFNNLGAHLGIQSMGKELGRMRVSKLSQSFSYFRHRSIVFTKFIASAMCLLQLHDVWKVSNNCLNFWDPCGKIHHKGGHRSFIWTHVSVLPPV